MSDTGAVILDTHVWVWAMAGAPQLRSQPARRAIERASEYAQLHLCSISLLELGVLAAAGRVSFTLALEEWVAQALKTPGLVVSQLVHPIALEAARLPGEFAGDLFDRVIAATARKLGGTLLTADRRLLTYGEQGYLTALNPTS